VYWNKLLLAAALTWGVPTIDDAMTDTERLKPAKRAVARLQTESEGTLTIEWNKAAATPGLISGYLTKPSNHSPQWISIEFLKQVKALYGLKRVDEQMAVIRILHEPDRTKVILQRQLYGKPVCGNELTVEMDKSGVIVRVDGTIHAELEKKRLNRPMYPAITGDEAAAEASRYVDGRYPAEAARVHACYLPSREGVPLIYVVSFDTAQKDGSFSPIKIHSLTGRVIE
jgi:Zn-dependent metalloprotease